MIKCSVHGIDNIQLYQYLIGVQLPLKVHIGPMQYKSDIKFVVK